MMIKLTRLLQPYSKYIFAAWAVTILVMSSIPGLPTLRLHTQSADIRLDYLIHFFEYGFLAFMGFLAFGWDNPARDRKKLLFVFAGLVLFAVADELHQKLIPGRRYNPKDLASNIAGIIAALIIFSVILRKIASPVKKP